ncbi:MAG: FKBP-type peptidyl-prolyl cis-trans isomerase [Thioalkalivibrio sp.]|nr:MAG: FKBP-type peptidyl-prolyl cis-trans isomerase [Thioalkalivibrio sp.]
MLRVILFSLLALVVVFIVAQSLGLTPEQIEDQILLAELNAEEGAAYRESNGRRAGVVTMTNGLQVEVLNHGDGPIPAEDDWVRVHYQGWHVDGREFENSRRRGEPATVTVANTIPGWRQVLEAIPVGSHVRLVVPPELAYGRPGGGRIGPEETLIFDLELLAIVEPDPPMVREEWEKPVPGLR